LAGKVQESGAAKKAEENFSHKGTKAQKYF
jgi:hypothetical protein